MERVITRAPDRLCSFLVGTSEDLGSDRGTLVFVRFVLLSGFFESEAGIFLRAGIASRRLPRVRAADAKGLAHAGGDPERPLSYIETWHIRGGAIRRWDTSAQRRTKSSCTRQRSPITYASIKSGEADRSPCQRHVIQIDERLNQAHREGHVRFPLVQRLRNFIAGVGPSPVRTLYRRAH